MMTVEIFLQLLSGVVLGSYVMHNWAHIKLGAYEERKNHSQGEDGVNLAALPCVIFIICGFLGNSLVCLSILSEKRLQNVTNYFLFSLAFADLLVCVLVMPLSLINEFHYGLWHYSVGLCKLFVTVDVFLCSVSIVHMSVISLDRYWGISRPLKTRNKSKNVLALKILGVWLITCLFACPIPILAIADERNVYINNLCQVFNSYFQIFGSIATFFIPFVVMAVTYTATVRLLHKQALICSGDKNGGSSGVGLRRTMTIKTPPTRKHPVKRTLSACSTRSLDSSPVSEYRRHFSFRGRGTDQELRTIRAGLEAHYNRDSIGNKPASPGQIRALASLKENFARAKEYIAYRKQLGAASSVANEQKATKVLGVVFCSFFICWVPFFTANITLAFCGEPCISRFPPKLGSVLLWLGYLSSCINPIIYTTFNQVFRATFKRLLRGRWKADNNFVSSNLTTGLMPLVPKLSTRSEGVLDLVAVNRKCSRPPTVSKIEETNGPLIDRRLERDKFKGSLAIQQNGELEEEDEDVFTPDLPNETDSPYDSLLSKSPPGKHSFDIDLHRYSCS